MDAERVRALTDKLDGLRRKLMELEGKDVNDTEKYCLYPPVDASAITRAEETSGLVYPASYRSFLEQHNGWLGFWPSWSLVGIEAEYNRKMVKNVKDTMELLNTVADAEEQAELAENEKTDPDVILVTNHPVLGTDFNGSLLLLDRNRLGADGKPEIAWLIDGMHVERRWTNLEELMLEAIKDTEDDIAKLSAKNP
jgi:hypothetical protein